MWGWWESNSPNFLWNYIKTCLPSYLYTVWTGMQLVLVFKLVRIILGIWAFIILRGVISGLMLIARTLLLAEWWKVWIKTWRVKLCVCYIFWLFCRHIRFSFARWRGQRPKTNLGSFNSSWTAVHVHSDIAQFQFQYNQSGYL